MTYLTLFYIYSASKLEKFKFKFNDLKAQIGIWIIFHREGMGSCPLPPTLPKKERKKNVNGT